MRPDWISSQRTRPGRIGNPAASAEVQVSGRRASETKLKTAPEPASHPPLPLWEALNIS